MINNKCYQIVEKGWMSGLWLVRQSSRGWGGLLPDNTYKWSGYRECAKQIVNTL